MKRWLGAMVKSVVSLIVGCSNEAPPPSAPLDIHAAASTAPANMSVSELIDDLVNIHAPAIGVHPTALCEGFLPVGDTPEFAGGVIGSVPPQAFPQMIELVRRGAASLPLLIDHLADARPTRLSVEGVGGGFFSFACFSDEYDARVTSTPESTPNVGRDLEGNYTVRVGDVCFVLIGQIVNRNLLAVRYQPTAGLVVNSPIEAPSLVEKVRSDWGATDAADVLTSLLADARSNDDLLARPALVRLRFYFSDEYQRQRAAGLRDKIEELESAER